MPKAVDVVAIRERQGLSQPEFAARYCININTLRHWEYGQREPDGPARAYLIVIDRAPEAVAAALRTK